MDNLSQSKSSIASSAGKFVKMSQSTKLGVATFKTLPSGLKFTNIETSDIQKFDKIGILAMLEGLIKFVFLRWKLCFKF